jgi:hypothetical protein
VELSTKFAGLECLLCGVVSLYPSLASVSVSSWICGFPCFAVKVEVEIFESFAKGNEKSGRLSILYIGEGDSVVDSHG